MVTEILLCGLGSLCLRDTCFFPRPEHRQHPALYTLHKSPKDRASPSGPTNMITCYEHLKHRLVPIWSHDPKYRFYHLVTTSQFASHSLGSQVGLRRQTVMWKIWDLEIGCSTHPREIFFHHTIFKKGLCLHLVPYIMLMCFLLWYPVLQQMTVWSYF